MAFGLKRLVLVASLMVSGIAVPSQAAANGVTLGFDTSFGSGGVVTHAQPVGASPTDPVDGLVDSSGRLVSLVNFNVLLGGPYDGRVGFVVARHTNAGLPDTNFGINGVTAPVPSTSGSALVELPDGTLVVGAVGSTGSILRAYTTTGELKTSFGNNGIAFVSRDANTYSRAEIHVKVQGARLVVALLPNGRTSSQSVVTQVHGFTFDGAVDNTYGNQGLVTLQVNTAIQNFILEDIEVTINNQLLLLGNAALAPTQQQIDNQSPEMFAAVVVRLRSDGNLDTDFANSGFNVPGHLVVPPAGSPFMEATRIAVATTQVAADSSYGKLMVTGRMGTDPATSEIFFARFSANGMTDTGFGSSGILDTNITAEYGNTRISDIHMMSNGESRATMFQDATTPKRSAVLGITEMGVISQNTILWLGAGNSAGVNRILAESGQNFVVLATTDVNVQANVYVRINAAGEHDAMYGISGLAGVPVELNAPGTLWLDAVRQTDGTLLMAGSMLSFDSSGDSQISGLIARVSASGAIDTTFGTNGYVRIDIVDFGVWVNNLVALSSGKFLILLNGIGLNGSYARVARMNANGSLDTTFGMALGFTDIADTYRMIGYPGESSMSMITDTSGRIVIVGTVKNSDNDDLAFMQRMNAEGILDNTFDGSTGNSNGFVTFTFPGEHGLLDVVSHSRGGYVVVGQDEDVPFVARISEDGIFDTSFGSRTSPGVQPIEIADGRGGVMNGAVQSLAQLSSGGIIVTGSFYDFPSETTLHFVARFSADGEADTSYDGSSGTGNGLVTFSAGSDDFEERHYGMTALDDGSVVLAGFRMLMMDRNARGLDKGFLIALDSSGRIDRSQGVNGYHFVGNDSSWNALSGVIQVSANQLMTFGTFSDDIVQHAFVSRFTVTPLSTAIDTPTLNSPTVEAPVTSAPLADSPAVVAPVASPVSAPVAAPVADIAVVAVATPVKAVPKLVKPVVRRKKSVTRTALMKYMKLTMPKGSKVTITVSARSKRFCKLSKTRIVYVRPGKCLVRVTVRPKKGIMRSATTTMLVKR